jgi:hypothetical protein
MSTTQKPADQGNDEPIKVIKTILEDEKKGEKIRILLKEYELAIDRLDRSEDRAIQILSVGFAFFGGVAVLLGGRDNNDVRNSGGTPTATATIQDTAISSFTPTSTSYNQVASLSFDVTWLLPLFIILFYGLISYVLYSYFRHLWLCRILSQRINVLVNDNLPVSEHEQLLIRLEHNLPISRFFSFGSGHTKPRAGYWLIIVCGSLVFLASVWFIGGQIGANYGPAFAIVFGVIYMLLFVWTWYATSGMANDMTNEFQRFLVMTGGRDALRLKLKSTYPPLIKGRLLGKPYRNPMLLLGFAICVVIKSVVICGMLAFLALVSTLVSPSSQLDMGSWFSSSQIASSTIDVWSSLLIAILTVSVILIVGLFIVALLLLIAWIRAKFITVYLYQHEAKPPSCFSNKPHTLRLGKTTLITNVSRSELFVMEAKYLRDQDEVWVDCVEREGLLPWVTRFLGWATPVRTIILWPDELSKTDQNNQDTQAGSSATSIAQRPQAQSSVISSGGEVH